MRGAWAAGAAALRGRLPARYAEPWSRDFDAFATPAMRPGAVVLDVGSGRSPTYPPGARPAGIHYVGLDLSARELRRAPPGSYDELAVGDVEHPMPQLGGRFDLILSWQVLEHVRDMAATLECLRSYLRPGGRCSILLSGRWSAFGILNRLLPSAVGVPVVTRAMGRKEGTVFRAHYDRCTATAIDELLAEWRRAEVLPAWRGADYFGFLRPLQAAYVAYEEWAMLAGRRDLATHYFLHLAA